MKYTFPYIKTIDDVLPYIDGRDEFVVAEREFGSVINYNVVLPDTFPPVKVSGGDAKMREQRALENAIRRECRGIIFDKGGHIISRPFHKFFNIGERPETLPNNIDLTQNHTVFEKMDGSMIRPLILDGEVRLATKMGFSDVAIQAEEWLNKQKNVEEMKKVMHKIYMTSFTPIFEFISPKNKIVVHYDEADLVLLALRDNHTGEYLPFSTFEGLDIFTHVPSYGKVNGNLDEFLKIARDKVDREGDIIRFSDGHMLKTKSDWYVRIHKMKDKIVFDRNIINLILEEEIDDVIPMLQPEDVERIRLIEKSFWESYKEKLDNLRAEKDIVDQLYDNDKKTIALEYVPKLENRMDAQFIFKMIDGHDPEELLMNKIKSSLNTNVKWEECKKWMGMK